MVKENPKILVLSSVSPSVGPAVMGAQIYEALKQKGLDVDFMTKYPEPDHPEYLWVVEGDYDKKFWARLKRKLNWWFVGGYPKEKNHRFFYTYENEPPVPSRLVANAIKKQYDLVYILFWQTLLSFETVEQIYDKLHCQIIFGGVDYSHMSGGCHFTGDCQRYKIGCGMCPAFHSNRKNDFTAWNVRFRKRVYEKVKPIVCGNFYMCQFYKDAYLLKNARIEICGNPIINTDLFRPLDVESIKVKYNIPFEKEHIIFFGCYNLTDKRKGITYLLDAFNVLYHKLGSESSKLLIITAGHSFEKIKDRIPFDSTGFGYVMINELPELYSLASLFVCPSVDDAGPMMVNQSLCCGTPVVGFDIGAVKQVVKDKGTGICVPLRDVQALADGMLSILQMPSKDYQLMSRRAREVAVQTSSYDAQANGILASYRKYRDEK